MSTFEELYNCTEENEISKLNDLLNEIDDNSLVPEEIKSILAPFHEAVDAYECELWCERWGVDDQRIDIEIDRKRDKEMGL